MRLPHRMIILCGSNEEACRQAGNALSSDKSGQDFASDVVPTTSPGQQRPGDGHDLLVQAPDLLPAVQQNATHGLWVLAQEFD